MTAKKPAAPKSAQRFLLWFLRNDIAEEVLGDLDERFFRTINKKTVFRAKLNYWYQVVNYLRPFAIQKTTSVNFNGYAMFKNYLKIAFRSLLKYKGHTAINLVGLSLGLTVGVLILIFVTDELGYDNFHSKGDRIYKIVTANVKGGGIETNAWPVAYKIKTDFPEVEAIIYTRKAPSSFLINHEGNRYEQNIFYAGEDFFKIFSFNMIEGNPETALKDPFSIIITEEMKQLYFSSERVLGETITLRDSLVFTITGVLENIPGQSHIQFDMLISFTTFVNLADGFSYSEGWGNFNVRNYMLLKEGANFSDIQGKASSLYMDNVGKWLADMGVEFYVDFIPLKEIYLTAETHNGFGPKGSIDLVYLVSAIGIFVILLACINFVNLTTARSVYRAKEVGLRKIIGSSKSSLFWQFMSEAFMLTLSAFITALLLIKVLLPFFNEIMGKTYMLQALLNINVLAGILFIIILMSFLAGFYPAMVLSAYKPIEVLSGSMQSSPKGVWLRRSLVVFQFLISGGLVLATLVALNQMDYMRNMDLGFDKQQILVVDATRVSDSGALEAFKNTVKSLSGVENVTHTNALPGRPGWLGQWAYAEEVADGNQIDTEYMAIDEQYIATLGLDLIAGTNFDVNNTANLADGLIINETMVREMGWVTAENALGKKIVSPSNRPAGTVIGVVKDYHGVGLQNHIWPKAMDFSSQDYGRYYAIRFTMGVASDLVSNTRQIWSEHNADYAFEYFFLDQDFDRQYRSEERLIEVSIIFAIITTIIAGIGLLGLVSFMVLSRVKEIGIRKVLGANISSIALLLSREFLMLVILANVILFPLIWHFGNQWLESFAYHTTINPLIFIITLGITCFMAIVTVIYHTIKAGQMNPVEVLKVE